MSRLTAQESERIAAEVLSASSTLKPTAPFTGRLPGFDLEAAYSVTAAIRRARVARGERPIGRKIGFTNRTIWPEYGVYAPIWGDMYDSTLRDLADTDGTLALAPLLEPRIEPEIAFGFAAAPQIRTVTRAFPVAPGETWQTRLIGLPLDGIALRFT